MQSLVCTRTLWDFLRVDLIRWLFYIAAAVMMFFLTRDYRIGIAFLAVFSFVTLANLSFVAEMKLTQDTLGYRKITRRNLSVVPLSDIEGVAFFQKVIERGESYPELRVVLKNQKRISLRLPFRKSKTYSFLSALNDIGIEVFLFQEMKPLKETKHYITKEKYSLEEQISC
jgi:hypothetical protein